MAKVEVNFEQIEQFLLGKDPQKYIVAIEASYHENFVSLIINDPERGKFIEKHTLNPFLWFKHDVVNLIYDGNKSEIKKAGADNKMFLLMVDEAFKYDVEESTTKKILAGVKFGRDVFTACMSRDK